MHKLKKATAQVTLKTAPENAEFNDFRNRLENLSTYLKSSSKALNESEQAWKEVCNKQKQFAETFVNRYPDKDDIREFGKQSSIASQKLVKEFTLRLEGQQAKHWEVDAVVQEYLAEINSISAEYKPINAAHTEVAMYDKKVADLQKVKKPDEAKIARNMEKLEEAKKKYEEILDRVVDHMKEVYNKRQVALKATYVAYWSSQLRAFDLVDNSLRPTRDFVAGSVDSIANVKISRMTADDVKKFIEEHSTLECTSPRGADATSPASSSSPASENPKAPFAEGNAPAEKNVPTSPVEETPEAPAAPEAAAV